MIDPFLLTLMILPLEPRGLKFSEVQFRSLFSH